MLAKACTNLVKISPLIIEARHISFFWKSNKLLKKFQVNN